jgi:gluconolactonase
MTDSGIRFEDWLPDGKNRAVDALIDGRVYRIDIKTRKVTQLDSGIRFTNGVAFGPNQQLYVTEMVTGIVYRYNWRRGGIVGRREGFGNVIDLSRVRKNCLGPVILSAAKNPGIWNQANAEILRRLRLLRMTSTGIFPQPVRTPIGFKGPDGIAFGENGNLFVTVFGQGSVAVLGKDGDVVERIRMTGQLPTNVAFGAWGENKIYVTEGELGQIEVFDVGTNGLPLFG